ncbi:MAG TPA: branched-chain amino acid transaminase [Terriglobales bacterium]|nr:branched-chain amino acid transaminase [Terriglobales bacterium]
MKVIEDAEEMRENNREDSAAMKTTPPDQNIIVWFQDAYVRLGDANVNILTHGLNYGTGVFEGIRGYYSATENNLFLNRAVEHYERWKDNCSILRIEVGPSARELAEITAELCRKNQFASNIYVRPLAFKASARIGVHSDDNDAFAIVAVPYGDYVASANGLRAGVVSWRRVDDNAIPGRGKICGAYANSVLAGDEARRNGHDEAIFLTQEGHVAEGAACNLFMVRKGQLITPPVSDNILEGITRASLIELAHNELGLDVAERSIDRSELYIADEIFFCGTAVELAPVTQVDHRPVRGGQIGPLTLKLRSLYADAVRGRIPKYRHWLYPAFSAQAVEESHAIRV